MLTEDTSVKVNSHVGIPNSNKKTLIILSAPSVKDEYYSADFTSIIDYMINFANIVNGKDEVAILVDDDTLPFFQGKVPSNILIKANILDIWIRDFSPVIPAKQVKFKFSPSYLPTADTKEIVNSFEKWLSQIGLHHYNTSDIILDGGNVVDNAAGTRVIVTDRILRDNPSLTKASAKKSLKQVLGVNQVAIIKALPTSTTGHADGTVMWATDERILLRKVDEPIRTEIINELKSSFRNVEIIELPDYYKSEMWRGFITANNVYVNSIVTDNYIYMPTFNNSHDTEMLQLFQSYTNKMVVPVPVENICKLGGSVRCLCWQVKGANKMKIIQSAVQ